MDAYLCNFVHLSDVHSGSSKPLFQTDQFGIHAFPQFLIFNIIQYKEVSKFPGFTLAMWSHLIDSEYFPTEPCLSGDLLGTFCRGEGIDVFTNNLFKILRGSRLIIKHWRSFPYLSIYAWTLKFLDQVRAKCELRMFLMLYVSTNLTQNVKSTTSTNPSQDSSWLSPAVSWMGRSYMSEKDIRQKYTESESHKL